MRSSLLSACSRCPWVQQWRVKPDFRLGLQTRTRQAQHSAVKQETEPWHSTDAYQKRLYVLDLLPLVYRFLPKDGAVPEAGTQHLQVPQRVQADQTAGTTDEIVNMMLGLMTRKEQPPSHMAVVVDVPGATYRRLEYPQYKAHRAEHPPQLRQEISRILAVVEAVGLPILAVPGVEADDVIGTLTVRAAQDGFEVVIVSSDKDFYQLLSPSTSVLHRPPSGPLYTLQNFQADYQLTDPKLWVDVKAFMGDASDNIPGVRGIGQKTALQLVQSWGSVEQVFEQLAVKSREEQQQVVKLSKNRLEALQSKEGQTAAWFAKQLVSINTGLKAPPLGQPWSMYQLKLPQDGGQLALQRADKLNLFWSRPRLLEVLLKWQAAQQAV